MKKIALLMVLMTVALMLNAQGGEKKVPNFTLPDFSGKLHTLSDYEGLVILDLWATWCPPCQQEIPVLQKLYDEYKDRGLHVIGVSIEDMKTQNAFKTSMMNDGIPMDYVMLIDSNREVFGEYGVQSIPTTIFIKDGKFEVFRELGFTPAYEKKFREIIEANLPK